MKTIEELDAEVIQQAREFSTALRNECIRLFKSNFETTQILRDVPCSHDLKEYFGFAENYKYCTKCPHKESL